MNDWTSPVDIRPDHLEMVQDILRERLPAGFKVWVFGSRATWTTKDSSDLDLAVEGDAKLDYKAMVGLEVAFEESDLPYTVDVVDLNDVSSSFKQIMEGQRVLLPNGTLSNKDWLYHPPFPENWDRRPLYSLAEWVNGLAFRNIQFSPTGMPVIKIAEIKGGISGQTKFTSQQFDESVLVSPGDLLFSWSGQPETSIDAFWWRGPEGWLNQHVFRVTPDPCVDGTFFYYLLRYLKPNFVAIARNKQTTGLGHVTRRDLENIGAAIPPLTGQRAIAHFLGTLDDKIELNRRMNQTLEAMAQAIFQDWFVDFGPVRAKIEGQDPYLPPELWDLFADDLVDSELGEIPEGWEVRALDDIADYQNGLALQRFRPGDNEERLPAVKIAQLRTGKADAGEWARATIRPECIIDNGDVIFSWSGSLMVKVWYGGRAALNQHLFKVTSKGYPRWFYLQRIESHLSDFQSIAADKTTTMGHIKREHLSSAKCVVPGQTFLKAADEILGPLFTKQISVNLCSNALESQRDTLLPKLISGEIQVG